MKDLFGQDVILKISFGEKERIQGHGNITVDFCEIKIDEISILKK